MMKILGEMIANISEIVDGGVLEFYSSYSELNRANRIW